MPKQTRLINEDTEFCQQVFSSLALRCTLNKPEHQLEAVLLNGENKAPWKAHASNGTEEEFDSSDATVVFQQVLQLMPTDSCVKATCTSVKQQWHSTAQCCDSSVAILPPSLS